MRRTFAALFLAASPLLFAQDTRVSSDFELSTATRRAATARTAIDKISAQLNLGDLRTQRRESVAATKSYETALTLATEARKAARRISDLDGYARATSYAGLTLSRLGRSDRAIDMFEESIRYSSDSASNWNLYSSAMLYAGRAELAERFASNAVHISEREVSANPSPDKQLDLLVYRYAHASALAALDRHHDAVSELRIIETALLAPRFGQIRRALERSEEFEVFSSTRTDAGTYLSLLQRTRQKLGATLEAAGDPAGARASYQRVLQQRSDDATALAALARLSASGAERRQRFVEAFDADPFSFSLIRDYQASLALEPAAPSSDTTAGRVRSAVELLHAGRHAAAEAVLTQLRAQRPNHDVLLWLSAQNAQLAGKRNEAAAFARGMTDTSLRDDLTRNYPPAVFPLDAYVTTAATGPVETTETMLAALLKVDFQRLTSQQKQALDSVVLKGDVTFDAATARDGLTVLTEGRSGSVRLRFSEPTAFRGVFMAARPLQLEFRVLGTTEDEMGPLLLVEPVRLSQ